MKKIIALLLVALFSIGAFAAEAKPKIGMKRAQEIASTKAPGLKLKAKELEHEKGRWIYSFEFKNKNGTIREDGQVMRDFYTFRIKKPAESKNEWDLYSQVAMIPAAQAFQPANKQVCPLAK